MTTYNNRSPKCPPKSPRLPSKAQLTQSSTATKLSVRQTYAMDVESHLHFVITSWRWLHGCRKSMETQVSSCRAQIAQTLFWIFFHFSSISSNFKHLYTFSGSGWLRYRNKWHQKLPAHASSNKHQNLQNHPKPTVRKSGLSWFGSETSRIKTRNAAQLVIGVCSECCFGLLWPFQTVSTSPVSKPTFSAAPGFWKMITFPGLRNSGVQPLSQVTWSRFEYRMYIYPWFALIIFQSASEIKT